MYASNYSINFTEGLLSSGFATIKQMFFNVSSLKSQVILTDGVMINFMSPFDWAMGCPHIWLITVSGCVCSGASRRGQRRPLWTGGCRLSPVWKGLVQSVGGLQRRTGEGKILFSLPP